MTPSTALPELFVGTALASEAETLLRGGSLVTGLVAAPAEVRQLKLASGGAVLAGFCGMGAPAVERLFAALAKGPGPHVRRVVFGGVAGALRADLAPGALVLVEAAQVVPDPATSDASAGGGATRDGRLECDPGLTARLAEALTTAGVAYERGLVLEVSRLAGGPEAKRDLARRFPDAHVVAMEDAAAIRGARALGAEVAILRVVIDALGDALPDLSPALDAVGRPRPLKLAAHLASRPAMALALPGLARSFNKARATLDRALQVALTLA